MFTALMFFAIDNILVAVVELMAFFAYALHVADSLTHRIRIKTVVGCTLTCGA